MESLLEIHGLDQNNLAYCEAIGLSKLFAHYAEHHTNESIESTGFNCNSGYTYIALECGYTLGSCVGGDVEYIVTNFEDGAEYFLDTKEKAEAKLVEINNEIGSN